MADQNVSGYGARWSLDGRSILAPEILGKVRASLSKGWVLGLHQYFGGGRSGDAVAFVTYTDFFSHVNKARPGDLFTLWSVDDLRREDLILAGGHSAAAAVGEGVIEPGEMERVIAYLKHHNEVLVAACYGANQVEAIVTDEDFVERIRAMAVRANVSGGEMWVLPLTTIDQDRYYLAHAKRPNAAGEVPLGGAY